MRDHRAELLQPQLNCLSIKCYERAVEIAESGDLQGVFRGVPFLFKDLFTAWEGIQRTEGSRAFRGQAPETYTAPHVQALLEMGLVPFGLTNTPELGVSLTSESHANGAVRNPWNPLHSAGGSSGGAAAAVAAGIVPIAHATDGGGSIRIPASANGLVGLLPSRALVPSCTAYDVEWAGCVGSNVVTRTIRDTALALDGVLFTNEDGPIAPNYPGTTAMLALQFDPDPLVIGVTPQHPDHDVDPQVLAALEQVIARLEAFGHRVEEAAPQIDEEARSGATLQLIGAELDLLLAQRAEQLGCTIEDLELEASTRAIHNGASGGKGWEYLAATQAMHAVGRSMANYFSQYDVWLTPTLSQPPAPIGYLDGDVPFEEWIGRSDGYAPYVNIANLAGLPSISLPLGWSNDDLPLGMLFTAPQGGDDLLISLGAQFEREEPFWQGRTPAIVAVH